MDRLLALPRSCCGGQTCSGSSNTLRPEPPLPWGGAGGAARPLRADLKCPSGIQCCAALRNGSACSLAFYGKECLCNMLIKSDRGSLHRPRHSHSRALHTPCEEPSSEPSAMLRPWTPAGAEPPLPPPLPPPRLLRGLTPSPCLPFCSGCPWIPRGWGQAGGHVSDSQGLGAGASFVSAFAAVGPGEGDAPRVWVCALLSWCPWH